MSKIPKIIHFVWLGNGEYDELIKKCLDSWKSILCDYEIMIWNETNIEIEDCIYAKQAYAEKQYAFVSDYVRLKVLYEYGGIYLDSDIEVLKKFDDLLEAKAFTCFENDHAIAAWIFGSEKGNPIFKEFMEYYQKKPFILEGGEYDKTPNPVPMTKICIKNGLKLNGKTQDLCNIIVYQQDYFCPYNRATEELNITENTYCIHYFNGTWISDSKKEIIMKRKKVIKKYGLFIGYIYYGMCLIKTEGLKQFINEFMFFMKK